MIIRLGTFGFAVASIVAFCCGSLTWGIGLYVAALIMRIIEN